jgi:hypothetical protein
MKWLTFVSLLIQLALQVMRYLKRQDALKEGEERALKELEAAANELISRARHARANINHTDDAVLRDPYNDATREGSEPPTDTPNSV